LARAGREGHLAQVGVTPAPGGALDVHLRIPPGDVVDALVGWRPPRSWWAVGLLAPAAQVRRSPAGRPGRAVGSPPGPCGVALLVARDGSTAVALVDEAGPWDADELGRTVSGPLQELCRRALGLPTPACTASPRRLWAAAWLDAVVRTCADRPCGAGSLRWPALAALHPLRAVLGGFETPSPDALAHLAAAPPARASWGELRQAAAGALLALPDTPRELAEWFDDGSFGRWLLGRYPPPEQLLAALRDLLAPTEHALLAGALAAWDVGAPRPGAGGGAEQADTSDPGSDRAR
jgi:hypothetical protein